MELSDKVFVYGTLKEGYGNHEYCLKNKSIKLGDHVTPEEYTMISLGGFPGVLMGGDTAIKGEVYQVDNDSVMEGLDRLEGYPTFYNRKLIPTEYGDAWIYYLEGNGRDRVIVPSGEWKRG